MSLVGTRPPTVDEWDKYELHHRARLATKPGLTGMWQVSGRSNITDFEEVVKLDKQYISEWTMGLDIKILFKTVQVVFKKEGSMQGVEETVNEGRKYTPEDFVIATGEQHTVRDFTEKAFAANGITIRWEGEGINEKGYDAETGKMLVCVNPQWFRPTDVDNLWGDPTKAKTVLGWNPQKTSYEELVEIMAKHDRALAKKEAAMKNA